VLALKTMFDPRAAADLDATYELRLGAHVYRLRVHDGSLDAARGEWPDADATIETEPETLAAALWHGGRTPLRMGGDRKAAQRFLTLFG
jgi:hypothetical protein